jgi:hypothetical protein
MSAWLRVKPTLSASSITSGSSSAEASLQWMAPRSLAASR